MKELRPSFQWYPKDIQGDGKYRALPQGDGSRGAYRDLLDFCWIEIELPLDDAHLASLVGLTIEQWIGVRDRVLALFKIYKKRGVIRHKRLDAERKKQAEYTRTQSESGKKGADSRWRKDGRTKPINGEATKSPMAKNGSSSPTPSPSPTPIPPTSTPPLGEEKEESSCLAARPPFGPTELQRDWNEVTSADGLRTCRELSKARRVAATARIRDHPDEPYWAGVILRIAKSDFCRGENDRGWKADFDFLVRRDTHLKVLEGKYDNAGSRLSAPGSKTRGNAEAMRRFVERGKELEDASK